LSLGIIFNTLRGDARHYKETCSLEKRERIIQENYRQPQIDQKGVQLIREPLSIRVEKS